jgi:hypothetical protein
MRLSDKTKYLKMNERQGRRNMRGTLNKIESDLSQSTKVREIQRRTADKHES